MEESGLIKNSRSFFLHQNAQNINTSALEHADDIQTQGSIQASDHPYVTLQVNTWC